MSCDDEAEPEPAGRRDGWRVIGAHVSEPEAGEVSSQMNDAADVTSRFETAHSCVSDFGMAINRVHR